MKLTLSSNSRRAERTQPLLSDEGSGGETKGILSDEMNTPRNNGSTVNAAATSSAHKRSGWKSFGLKQRSTKKATPQPSANNNKNHNNENNNRSSAKEMSRKGQSTTRHRISKDSTTKQKKTATTSTSRPEQPRQLPLPVQRQLAFDRVAEQSLGISTGPSFSSLIKKRPETAPILPPPPPAQEFIANWQATSFAEGSTATKTCYDDSHHVVIVPSKDTASVHSRMSSSSVTSRNSATPSQRGGIEMTYHQGRNQVCSGASEVQQQRTLSQNNVFRSSQKAVEENDDYGTQDFNPNDERDDDEDDSLFDDDNDTYNTGTNSGVQSSTHSAFQFDLSAGHLKPNPSTNRTNQFAPSKKSGSESNAETPSSTNSSQHGLRIISTKSSLSSIFSAGGKSKATATTAASTATAIRQTTSTATTSSPSKSSTLGSSISSCGSAIIPPAKKRAKAILARTFGRNSLPRDVFQWLVDVSPAEWDNQERSWKYRIKVHRRKEAPPSPASEGLTPITEAFTWRSLESFVWLEKALNTEFQGGLVLPLLSIALGSPDLSQVTHEVDAKLLQGWLSDVLNGIRGHGELILNHESVDLMRSESIETFLYRNTVPLRSPNNLLSSLSDDIVGRNRQRQRVDRALKDDFHSEGSNCHGCDPIGGDRSSQKTGQEPMDYFVNTLWSRPLALMNGELCVGSGCQHVTEDSPSRSSFSGDQTDHLTRFPCSPRDMDDEDSFVNGSTITSIQSSLAQKHQLKMTTAIRPALWRHARHLELINAERELVLSYRRIALTSLEKVRVLVEEEGHIGQSWKRFATALSNLFSFEKEVESARLGDKKISRDHMPFRKVKTSAVDQCLRTFANHKGNRSVPSLRILSSMLTAYIADLSAVEPSVNAYVDAMSQLAYLDDIMQKQQQTEEDKSILNGSATTTSSSTQTHSDATGSQNSGVENWRESLRSLATSSKIVSTIDIRGKAALKYVGDLRAGAISSAASDEGEGGMVARESDLQRKRVVEGRVLANERLLKDSLTTLCKATNIRTARVAWMYFKSEATQCSLSLSAAVSLRDKIDVPDKEAVVKMGKRHHDENKEDNMTELALVQRMVDLGSARRSPRAGSSNNVALHENIEVDSDNQDEESEKASQRDVALQIARERAGRWNSKLAMAIMTAVGVDDPNVRVDQTTRELRLVRKYAIGLREVLNRCIEAVEVLSRAISKGLGGDDTRNDGNHIQETRHECMKELARLFSGKLLPNNENGKTSTTKLLAENGIITSDPMGWSTVLGETSRGSKQGCGLASLAYTRSRDSQTQQLLSSLSELLNEYTQRVEIVESFVYMECVGVQLEKFFSQKRADALAAFEKKTDITTAINIATRKRLPGLVDELHEKLAKLGSNVTHTSVKETKEEHLESKSIKAALHDLALRRLLRARETSTERAINLLCALAKGEECSCSEELKAVGVTLETLENFMGRETMLGAGLVSSQPTGGLA